MNIKQRQLKYWLALLRAPGIGAQTAINLLSRVTEIEELFNLSRTQLTAQGLATECTVGLINPLWQLVDQDLSWLSQDNHHLITITNPLYPSLLKEIAYCPLALFVEGNPELLMSLQISIVGSRNPSAIGKETASAFAKQLAKSGLTITSGLAIGIDSASHQGALAAKGKTIAVLGTGLDQIYPKENSSLARSIVENQGAIISEFPIGTPIKAANFPRRNRIVSGLSLGTLVVEATMRSGSLITARLACEQGREVFAIPGSIHNPLAKGCHQLIRQGAKLIETAEEIIEELGPLAAVAKDREIKSPSEASTLFREDLAANTILDQDYKKLLQYIGDEATPIDILVNRSKMTVQELSSMLLILQLQGYIKNSAGGYVKVHLNGEDN